MVSSYCNARASKWQKVIPTPDREMQGMRKPANGRKEEEGGAPQLPPELLGGHAQRRYVAGRTAEKAPGTTLISHYAGSRFNDSHRTRARFLELGSSSGAFDLTTFA